MKVISHNTPIRIWRLSGMDCYGDDIATGFTAASGEALNAIRTGVSLPPESN